MPVPAERHSQARRWASTSRAARPPPSPPAAAAHPSAAPPAHRHAFQSSPQDSAYSTAPALLPPPIPPHPPKRKSPAIQTASSQKSLSLAALPARTILRPAPQGGFPCRTPLPLIRN